MHGLILLHGLDMFEQNLFTKASMLKRKESDNDFIFAYALKAIITIIIENLVQLESDEC